MKLTEVTVSDKLEEFRASKEVESTKQLSILLDKFFRLSAFAYILFDDNRNGVTRRNVSFV